VEFISLMPPWMYDSTFDEPRAALEEDTRPPQAPGPRLMSRVAVPEGAP